MSKYEPLSVYVALTYLQNTGGSWKNSVSFLIVFHRALLSQWVNTRV